MATILDKFNLKDHAAVVTGGRIVSHRTRSDMGY